MTSVNHGATETPGRHKEACPEGDERHLRGRGATENAQRSARARFLLCGHAMERVHRPPGASYAPIPAALNALTARIIGCAIEVHKGLGPGLLESAYDCAFCVELAHEGLQFQRQVACPVTYRGRAVGEYRLDFLIEDAVIVEVKAIERHEPVHVAQVLTYLRATGMRLGLLVNFNVPILRDGIRRVAL